MTYEEFERGIKDLGFKISYSHFEEKVTPPFLCFLDDGCEDFTADNKHFFSIKSGVLELYTNNKNPKIETEIEGFFNNNEILYKKMGTVYIDSEKLYETIYNINLI